MTTATLRISRISSPISAPKAAGKRLFWRFYDALVEARMQAAMRELRMHRHLIPEDVLKKAGYAASLNDDSAYPFTR
jgi:hypothetical protein